MLNPLPALLLVLCAGDPTLVDTDPAARQPQVCVRQDGAILAVYATSTEIRFVRSLNGGQDYSQPVGVAKVSQLALGMRRGPRIAATPDALIITAIARLNRDSPRPPGDDPARHQQQSAAGDVFAWRSTDLGATWSDPVRINSTPDSAREGLHALAAGPGGVVACAWLDLREERGMSLYGARSADGGATWQTDALVHRSPEKQVCTCCHPSLAFGAGGAEYLMWRDDIAGARDMYLSSRAAETETHTRPRKLGVRTWQIARCPMDGGAIAIDAKNRVATAWMRADQVYLTDPLGDEHRLGPGVQPWAAGGASGAHVVWLSRRPGRLLYQPPTAQSPQTLAESANDPVIASALGGAGPIVAAWEAAAPLRGIAIQVLEPKK